MGFFLYIYIYKNLFYEKYHNNIYKTYPILGYNLNRIYTYPMYPNFKKFSYIANFTDAVVAIQYLLELKLNYVVWLLNPGKIKQSICLFFRFAFPLTEPAESIYGPLK